MQKNFTLSVLNIIQPQFRLCAFLFSNKNNIYLISLFFRFIEITTIKAKNTLRKFTKFCMT